MDWGSVLQVVLGAFLGAAFFFIIEEIVRKIRKKSEERALLQQLKNDLNIVISELRSFERNLQAFSQQYDSPLRKLKEHYRLKFPLWDHTWREKYYLLRGRALSEDQWEKLTSLGNLLSQMDKIDKELGEGRKKYLESTTKYSATVEPLRQELHSLTKVKWSDLLKYVKKAVKTACELLGSLEADIPSELCPDGESED